MGVIESERKEIECKTCGGTKFTAVYECDTHYDQDGNARLRMESYILRCAKCKSEIIIII